MCLSWPSDLRLSAQISGKSFISDHPITGWPDHPMGALCAPPPSPRFRPHSTPFDPTRPHAGAPGQRRFCAGWGGCWDVMQRVTGQKHENPALPGSTLLMWHSRPRLWSDL